MEVTQKPEMSPGNSDNWDSDIFQIAEIHMAENFGMSRKLTGKLKQVFDNHAFEDLNNTNDGETVTSKYSIATELPPACASINEINVQPVGTKPLVDTGFIATIPFQDLSRPPSHHPTLNGAVLSPWFTPSPCSNPESHIPPPSTCKPQRPTSKYRLDRSCITAKVKSPTP